MRDLDEVQRDVPEVLFRRHPAAPIEARDVHGLRVSAQRLLAPQVEVLLEIRQRQVPDRAEDRLAKPEAPEVGVAHRSPSSWATEDRHDVVGVLHRLQVDDQGRVALKAQRGGGKERTVHALGALLAQDPARRTAVLSRAVVFERVEIALKAPGGRESPEERRLTRRESKIAVHGFLLGQGSLRSAEPISARGGSATPDRR